MIYAGIDIAKFNHYAAVISSDGLVLTEPFKFSNDSDGFLRCFLQAHFGKSCNIKMDNLACPKRTMLQPDPPADHARVIPLQTGFYYSR